MVGYITQSFIPKTVELGLKFRLLHTVDKSGYMHNIDCVHRDPRTIWVLTINRVLRVNRWMS